MRLLLNIIFGITAVSATAQIVSQGNFDNYELRYNEDDDYSKFDGTPYLNEDWHRAKVIINSDTLTYNRARFNLLRNFLEVMHKEEHKYIAAKYISSFQLKGDAMSPHSVYSTDADFAFKEGGEDGLSQISTIGNLKIITAYQARVRKQSKENPQLSGTGEKDKILIIKRNYILTDDGLHFIKKWKDISKVTPYDAKEIKNIVKSKSLDLSNHHDFVVLIEDVIN